MLPAGYNVKHITVSCSFEDSGKVLRLGQYRSGKVPARGFTVDCCDKGEVPGRVARPGDLVVVAI